MTVEFTHWSDWIHKDHVDELAWSRPQNAWQAFYRPNGPGSTSYDVLRGTTPQEVVEKYIAWYAKQCLLK